MGYKTEVENYFNRLASILYTYLRRNAAGHRHDWQQQKKLHFNEPHLAVNLLCSSALQMVGLCIYPCVRAPSVFCVFVQIN